MPKYSHKQVAQDTQKYFEELVMVSTLNQPVTIRIRKGIHELVFYTKPKKEIKSYRSDQAIKLLNSGELDAYVFIWNKKASIDHLLEPESLL